MAFDVGSVVAHVKADISGFKVGIDSAKKQTGDLKSSVSSLGSTLTKVAAVFGVALGAAAVVRGMQSAISASIQLENALLGLKTVAAATGNDIDKTTDAAQKLAADGLMSVSEAAEGLKNLLATGFSLPEAINLMNGFKDAAAFNRQGTLAFGQAIVGATQGIKNQNSIMVDNVGITKNLSIIMKEAGLSVDAMSEVTTDASVRQKLYNGLIKEASLFQGDAGRAAETMGGRISMLKTQSFQLAAAIGDALGPAITFIIEQFLGGLAPAITWIRAHMDELKAVALTLAGSFMIVGQIIIGIARMIQAAFTLNFNGVRDAFYDMAGGISLTVKSTQQKITDITSKETDKQVDITDRANREMSKSHNKKSKEVQKDLEEETRKYEEENIKRKATFEDRLQDLIFAHIDKKKQLEKDLVEENADFSETMQERKESFVERMEEMKMSHQEKVDAIQQQINEELARGEEADQKKIDDLKLRIEKENIAYATQVAKAEEREAEATAKLQKEHEKRVEDFQKRLKQEGDILTAHQSNVDAVKDKAREDDISRLKRQFNEENEASTKEHGRRMEEIAERGEALGDSLGGNINAGIAAQKGAIVGTMDDIGKKSGEALVKQISESARQAGEHAVSDFIGGVKNKAEEFGSKIVRAGQEANARGMLGPIFQAIELFKNLRGFANGGIVPGYVGEPQLAMVHGGEVVTPPGKSLGNIYNLSISLDGAMISDEAGATRLAEIVGDNIIRKLQYNVRF